MKKLIYRPSRSRYVRAADETDTRLSDLASNMEDDFNYLLDGFDRLEREGRIEDALDIMYTLNDAINQAILDSAELTVD